MLWLDLTLFGIVGFFIYPPVMLLGVTGLDFSSKKAVGTAAGFIGLFGYLGRTVQGKALGAMAEKYGWDAALYAILGSTFSGILLLSFTWKLGPRRWCAPTIEARRNRRQLQHAVPHRNSCAKANSADGKVTVCERLSIALFRCFFVHAFLRSV